ASFNRQSEMIRANGGRPVSAAETRQTVQGGTPVRSNVRIAPPARPAAPQNAQANRPGNPPSQAAAQPGNQPNQRSYRDRPPGARSYGVNPQLDERQEQQKQQLRQRQDQERQRVEQQQIQQQQKLDGQRANEQKQQQVQQKQSQQ